MASLWFKHSKWFRKQKPMFPKRFYQSAALSFARYRDTDLRSIYGDEFINSLSPEEREKLFFQKVWRGRSVTHYDYQMIDGHPYCKEITMRLPKLPFKKWFYKGRIRKGIKDKLPIKTSKTCNLVGITPFPLGSQPQKFTYINNNFYDYIDYSAIGDKVYDAEYHSVINVSGSWGSQIPDFQKLCDPIEHDVNYADYLGVVDNCQQYLALPMLQPPTVDDLLRVKTNQNAGTGLLSSRMFGNKHRRADTYAVRLAQVLYKRTAVSPCCDISCWSIGGRNRKQKTTKDGPLRSRIILMPEAPNKILGLAYAQRIYEAFGVLNWRNYKREVRIGNNDFHGNYFWYDEYMNKPGTKFVEFDISAHDANTAEITMVTAFGLLRSMFPRSEEIDNHFLYFMSGTIYKNVATPGRFIYKCMKGIPSGSPFTSILVSLVNWLNCRSFIAKHLLDTTYDSLVHVFGDDTLIRFSDKSIENNSKIIDTSFWIDEFKKWCGHKLDPCHIREWGTNDSTTSPTFLKTYSWHGLPARSCLDTMLSATIIRKSNRSLTRYANIIKGLCYAAPFEPLSYKFLEDFRSYLLRRRRSLGYAPEERSDPLTEQQISNVLRITWGGVTKQYLYPLVLGFDAHKNVDLGNKPSEYVKVGVYNDCWVDDIIKQGVFHKESYDGPTHAPNTISDTSMFTAYINIIRTCISILLIVRILFTLKLRY